MAESYRPEQYVADGSLRDVCVLDVDIPDWDRLLDSIETSGWEHSLDVTTSEPLSKTSGSAIFERLQSEDEASARLAVRAGDTWLTCYFFDPSEIEFSFDPSEISDQADFEALKEFMTWLAAVCRKPAIMTMETTDHRTIPALLEIHPPASA
jgi:hypothetical protein